MQLFKKRFSSCFVTQASKNHRMRRKSLLLKRSLPRCQLKDYKRSRGSIKSQTSKMPFMHSLSGQEGIVTISSNSSPQNDSWQALRQCCAEALFCVPKTWTDPFRSATEAMPRSLEGAIGYIQNQVRGSPWCDALALLSLLMAAENAQQVSFFLQDILGTAFFSIVSRKKRASH